MQMEVRWGTACMILSTSPIMELCSIATSLPREMSSHDLIFVDSFCGVTSEQEVVVTLGRQVGIPRLPCW